MQLPLRHGVYGGWRGIGDIDPSDITGIIVDSGELDLPSDPNAYSPSTGMPAITAPDLTPGELAAEQTRAAAWLAAIPGALSVAGKVALSASQIAAGVAAGNLKASSTCPSGYLVAGSGQCVTPPGSGSGVSSQTLGLIAVGFVFVMLLSSGKK